MVGVAAACSLPYPSRILSLVGNSNLPCRFRCHALGHKTAPREQFVKRTTKSVAVRLRL